MPTYWLLGQDNPPAKRNALLTKQNSLNLLKTSCASSIQDLEYFKSNHRLYSRRGSYRKSGAEEDFYEKSVRKSLPLASSTLAIAINSHLKNAPKNAKSPEMNMYLSIPKQQVAKNLQKIMSPSPSIHSRMSDTYVDFKGNVKVSRNLLRDAMYVFVFRAIYVCTFIITLTFFPD